MRKIALLIVALATLSSCGLYKKFEKPVFEDIGETDSLSVISWKEMFTDPALQALIDTALENNIDIKTAHLRLDQARESLRSARAAWWPSVSVNAAAGVPNNTPLDASPETYLSLGARADWQLDIFATRLNAGRKAAAAAERSEAYARAVRTDLIASVAQSYYTLASLDEQLRINEEAANTWESTIRVLSSLKAAGKTNEVAVLQAEARKLRIQSSVVALRRAVNASENALNLLLGRGLVSIARDSLGSASFPEDFLSSIPLGTIASRPDVRSAEFALAEACYDVKVARSALYPSVSLSGTLGWNSSTGRISEPSAWIWNALASLGQPVFAARANRSRLEIARSEAEIAKLQYRQTLLKAGNEVNDAIAACQAAKERIELDSKQQEALQKVVERIELLMKYSTTTYLEVLTAQQSFLDAELSLVAGKKDLVDAYIALYRAVGGGAF